MDDDLELLLAWRGGDDEAGNTLVRRHFRVVHRFFRSKVHEAVDDLIQRTFLGCIEAVDRFEGRSSFRNFLLGIARNQLLLFFRERAQVGRIFDPREHSVSKFGAGQSPSEHAALREEQRLLLAALRQLPLDLQITVELFYWEQMPVSEIGEVLDVPTGTVKSRLARARSTLRDRIAELAADDHIRTCTLKDLEGWARSLRDALAEGDAPPSPPA
ncbi:MAG: sigma-70 family RNA polymerase sigma factor [Myxococcota bacterium]